MVEYASELSEAAVSKLLKRLTSSNAPGYRLVSPPTQFGVHAFLKKFCKGAPSQQDCDALASAAQALSHEVVEHVSEFSDAASRRLSEKIRVVMATLTAVRLDIDWALEVGS